MNNRFGDSRQRFSIRKFTVGVASVLLSSAVFGVSTAKADQAEEPKGQPATSVLEEASESDGGGQRTSTSASSQEVTAEPTVQAESTSAISVTAVSSEVALQEQTVASSEQVHHKIRLVRGSVRNLLQSMKHEKLALATLLQQTIRVPLRLIISDLRLPT